MNEFNDGHENDKNEPVKLETIRQILGPTTPYLIRGYEKFIDREKLANLPNGSTLLATLDSFIDPDLSSLLDWGSIEKAGVKVGDLPLLTDAVMGERTINLPPIATEDAWTTDIESVLESIQVICDQHGLPRLTPEEMANPTSIIIAALNRLFDMPLSFTEAREVLLPDMPRDQFDPNNVQLMERVWNQQKQTLRQHAKKYVTDAQCGSYMKAFIKLIQKHIPAIKVHGVTSNEQSHLGEHYSISVIVDGEEIICDPTFMHIANRINTNYEPGIFVGNRMDLIRTIVDLGIDQQQAEIVVANRYGKNALYVSSDPNYRIDFSKKGPDFWSRVPALTYMSGDISFDEMERILQEARNIVEPLLSNR